MTSGHHAFTAPVQQNGGQHRFATHEPISALWVQTLELMSDSESGFGNPNNQGLGILGIRVWES